MSLAEDDGAAIREALTAIQRGDFAAAERTLRLEIKSRPADGAALTLLVALADRLRRAARRLPVCPATAPHPVLKDRDLDDRSKGTPVLPLPFLDLVRFLRMQSGADRVSLL